MDNTIWSNSFSYSNNIVKDSWDINTNHEYRKFLEDSGTDLSGILRQNVINNNVETFINAPKPKAKSKSIYATKKNSKTKISTVHAKRSKSRSKSPSKRVSKSASKRVSKTASKRVSKTASKKAPPKIHSTGINRKSKINTVHAAGKHLLKKGSKKVTKKVSKMVTKKGSKKITHRIAQKQQGKYEHKFVKRNISKTIKKRKPSPGPKPVGPYGIMEESRFNISPAIAPAFAPAFAPSFAPSIGPSFDPSFTPSFAPSIAPSFDPSFTPSFAPSIAPSVKSEYVNLPNLTNPIITTNPFSGVLTVAENNVGYRYDAVSNYGINFNETISNNYVYTAWKKLENGNYLNVDIKRIPEVILLVLEVNQGIISQFGEVASFNSSTGIYKYSSNMFGIEEGLRYDPKSRYGVDFLESNTESAYLAWIADFNGAITGVSTSSIPNNIKILLGIIPATPPKSIVEERIPGVERIPTVEIIPIIEERIAVVEERIPAVIQFNPDPTLIYRVTDTGANSSGTFTTHFLSPTTIILDSRAPTFDPAGNITGYGSTAATPVINSTISGPFVQKGTIVISVINIPNLPSNPNIPGQIITLSQPLVGIQEAINDVFSYTFTKAAAVIDESFLFKESSSLLYRITDIGTDSIGNFKTHFPSTTQIILDSRTPVIDASGNVINFGSTASTPKIGSTIEGPFVQNGTTVVSVTNIPNIPSSLSIPGQIITISQPLTGITEDEGQIFVYTFTGAKVPTGLVITLNNSLSYRVTDNGYDSTNQAVTHFPSSNQIILDSRQPTLLTDGPIFNSNSPVTPPTVGAIINGPFIQAGTTVTAVQTTGTIPSNSSIPAQIITISQPLLNIVEKPGDIYTYIFS